MGLAAGADADVVQSFSFARITNNSSFNIGSQLHMTASAPSLGSDHAFFTFTNNVGTSSSVRQIYFDGATLGSITSVTNSGGVSTPTFFQTNSASPPDLPGGNSITPAFSVNAGLALDTTGGPPGRGLNESADSVVVRINLANGVTFADTLAALSQSSANSNDWLRVGLHVQSIGGGTSDSYMSMALVPLPPAAWAGLATLAGTFGLGAVRRRARQL